MNPSNVSTVSVICDNVLSISFTDIEPEVTFFLTFSKITIIESLFSGVNTSKGFSTNLVSMFFCSFSKDDEYSYLPRGLEIFVNWELISFLIFVFSFSNNSLDFFDSMYFLYSSEDFISSIFFSKEERCCFVDSNSLFVLMIF